MRETWRWWLRGIAQYPQRSTPDQPFSPMQEVVLKLSLLDGLFCQWLCQAVVLKPEKSQPTPRKRKHPPQETSSSEREPRTLPSQTIPFTPTHDARLQGDLFTGTWADNRTESQKKAEQARNQPAQMTLFRQREIAQFGVRAHPQMPLSPHTKLVLIAEDPRTDEEKERDTQRAAEALTSTLFPEFPTPEEEEATFVASTIEPPPMTEFPDEPPESTSDLQAARLAIYLRLVQLAEAEESTAEQYPEGFVPHITLTVLDALDYGLQRAEIQAAMHIGQSRKMRLPAKTEALELPLKDEDEPTPDEASPSQQLGLNFMDETPRKLRAYLSLIQVVETHTRMGLSSTGVNHPQIESFAKALAAKATRSGLTEGEIKAALAIAHFRAGLRPTR
jgi:hypothetical protein